MRTIDDFQVCADRLAALAEPTRLQIISQLFDGTKNVGELCDLVDEDIVKVSHHLKMLKRIGFVENQKQGRTVIYRLALEFAKTVKPSKDGQLKLDLGCCELVFDEAHRKRK